MPLETNRSKEHQLAGMLDVHAVAGMLCCSVRHVYRLVSAGGIPSPVKLGTLVRWSRQSIHQWIVDGCPSAERIEGEQ